MDIKHQFPIFETNPDLVYLDNAATTQKPDAVIEATVDFYTHLNANVHRGLYPLSEAATELYELARRKVAKFINAEPEEVIFTFGVTDALNGLAWSLANSDIIKENPQIVTTDLEHHANLLPWQRISDNITYLSLDDKFQVELDETAISQADIITTTHVSNVTGTIVDLEKINNMRSDASILVVDAAQSIAHIPIDVKALDVDFLAFSGHKMYGPTGIGVLYGKKEHLQKLEPWRVGGGMIRSVTKQGNEWSPAPEKFEAGTPPIAQAIGLAAAIDFMSELGWD